MKIKAFILGVFLGFAVALLGSYFLGYTAAIAMPKSFINIAKESNLWQLYFILWDFIVVQLSSVGLISMIITYIAIRVMPWKSWWKVIGIAFGSIGLMYGFSPGLFKTAYIGHHLYGITILFCVFLVSYILLREKNA